MISTTSLQLSPLAVPIIVLVGFMVGCDDRGYELEYRLPFEPPETFELTVHIDTSSQLTRRKVYADVYAIDFDENGKATVNSIRALRGWRQEYVITPTRRLRAFRDYQLDANWEMATTRRKLPHGGFESRTVENNSAYRMRIQLKELKEELNGT